METKNKDQDKTKDIKDIKKPDVAIPNPNPEIKSNFWKILEEIKAF